MVPRPFARGGGAGAVVRGRSHPQDRSRQDPARRCDALLPGPGRPAMKREPWIIGMPARLETERFVVRSMRANDLTDNYLKWIADPELMRNLNTQAMLKA